MDFITGDYLAEMNLAEDAEAYRAGKHNGWEDTAWEGIRDSIDVLASKHIKVVINGGCLNPKGLAEKVSELVAEKGHNLKVAYVSGDDLLPKLGPDLASLGDKLPPHLDSVNPDITVPETSLKFKSLESVPLVSANAYLGARAIVAGLRAGADIIICGRVSDASPVIGAAWYWHDWGYRRKLLWLHQIRPRDVLESWLPYCRDRERWKLCHYETRGNWRIGDGRHREVPVPVRVTG